MPHVTKLSVEHVRNHTNKTINFEPNTTIITGKNGAGKTSLIEAVYIALSGSSFRGPDGEIIQKNQPWYRIELQFSDTSKRTVTFDSQKQTGKKQFTINGSKSHRLSAQHKHPVVLFEPEDLRLIVGSPTRRRYFIDHFVSQIDAEYSSKLHKYERALKQRNSLLKRAGTTTDDLFVWNVSLSDYGAYIIEKRSSYVELLNKNLPPQYKIISQTDDIVSIHYSHTLIGDTRQKLLTELLQTTQKDTILGFTSVGPHRDDILFSYNNSPALKTASRGETKSIVLALKFIEAEIIHNITDKKPIILFDDVFSELDENRQSNILCNDKFQIIITATHGVHKNTVRI